MASPTKKTIEKHPDATQLTFTPDDLRWATPFVVAEWRAKRLHCNTIVDLGCGVGFQMLSFAAHCKKVIAVEKDGRKLEAAKANAATLGLKNITFIHGDILDLAIVAQLPKLDVVFCDPERLPSEQERSVESITPDIKNLLVAYSKITDKIAIEFPPQIRNLPFDAEREYVSVDGALNRLTLYFGRLKKAERSAVLLPKVAVLCGNEQDTTKKTTQALPYLYEVDPAVVKAGLLGKLQTEAGALLLDSGKVTLMTSLHHIPSPFWKSSFHVLDTLPFEENKVKERLKQLGAGRVVLRIPVDAKDYWTVRKKYEGHGKRTVHLFCVGGMAVIAEAC